jgi:integrase
VKLTQATIARLKLPAGKTDVIFFDDEIPGFGLRLRAGGRRVWIAQYRIGSKQRRLSLGSADKVSAELARREAKNRLARVELGYDPQQEKYDTRAAAGQTVGKLVEDYLARRHYQSGKDALRKSSYEAASHYLRRYWAPLHAMQAGKANRSAVASTLAGIETKISSVTAARARVALATMFTWAIGQGIVDHNPVVGVTKPPEPKARDRVLSDVEVAEIWRACRGDDFGTIVKLLLLTAARRDEIADLVWSEIELDQALINLPPERVKNGRPHTLLLAPAAVDLLKSRPRTEGRDLVFGEGEGGYSGWSKAKAALDQRINEARAKARTKGTKPEPIADWRLHDLRRTAATRMNELGALPHVIETTLGHVSGFRAGVAGTYNRALYLPERRQAAEVWAHHVHSIVGNTERKVIPLARTHGSS